MKLEATNFLFVLRREHVGALKINKNAIENKIKAERISLREKIIWLTYKIHLDILHNIITFTGV